MLPQTKRAYDALRSVGLKRGDFSVRCPLTSKGYGDLEIVLYRTPYELADELAKKFIVVLFTIEGKYRGPILLQASSKPGLTVLELDDEQNVSSVQQ